MWAMQRSSGGTGQDGQATTAKDMVTCGGLAISGEFSH